MDKTTMDGEGGILSRLSRLTRFLTGDSVYFALRLATDCKAHVRDSKFERFGSIFYMERKSVAEMTNCSVDDCHNVIRAETSSSINVTDCVFRCHILLSTLFNKKGKVCHG